MLCALALLAGCAGTPRKVAPGPPPEQVRGQIERLLPDHVQDRQAWARDIQAAFTALQLAASTPHLCQVLAVTGQESGFETRPVVAHLGRIARREIDRRAGEHHVPGWVVSAALALRSPDGRSYEQRLEAARTEHDLSRLYTDFIGMVPLGRRLFGHANPVHTAGPMQVSVSFAEAFIQHHAYPYPVAGTVRDEVFSRRGGMYFGVAHLLDFPADYPRAIFRFADYNAGWYASRNAAFQQAVSKVTGISLALDGDLVRYGSSTPGATEAAVLTLGPRLDLSPDDIRHALSLGEQPALARTEVYRRVFALAEQIERHPLPRAVIPLITLESPKITRRLTTRWFAERVEQRFQRCMARATPALPTT